MENLRRNYMSRGPREHPTTQETWSGRVTLVIVIASLLAMPQAIAATQVSNGTNARIEITNNEGAAADDLHLKFDQNIVDWQVATLPPGCSDTGGITDGGWLNITFVPDNCVDPGEVVVIDVEAENGPLNIEKGFWTDDGFPIGDGKLDSTDINAQDTTPKSVGVKVSDGTNARIEITNNEGSPADDLHLKFDQNIVDWQVAKLPQGCSGTGSLTENGWLNITFLPDNCVGNGEKVVIDIEADNGPINIEIGFWTDDGFPIGDGKLESGDINAQNTSPDSNPDNEHGNDAEHHPECRGADGDRQAKAVTLDPAATNGPVNLFDRREDETGIPMDFQIGGEQALTLCSGEHWDAQDPNTQESDRNSETGGTADEPMVEVQEGDLYVNPLYDGDCSGWSSSHHSDGCPGGTQPPTFGEVVHFRLTADGPGTGDTQPEATTYTNTEVWGVGRIVTSASASHPDRGGWVALYFEDHSDQVFRNILGDPLNTGDGNYLFLPFDLVQGGSVGEEDCTSHEYQNEDPLHHHSCSRDNTAITGQFGYAWAPIPE